LADYLKRAQKCRRRLFEEIVELAESLQEAIKNKQEEDALNEKKRELCRTKEYLYSKTDLALVCLVLTTEEILKMNDCAFFQEIHVNRFNVVFEKAKAFIKSESEFASEMMEKFPIGSFKGTEHDYMCEFCGREIVNLCVGPKNVVDESEVYCLHHYDKAPEDSNIIWMLDTGADMEARFLSAKTAVDNWTANSKK